MILIVDDNQENIFALKSLLTLHKFGVDSASSGEEALKKIIQNSYSLIILDVQMPDMDGFEVAEAITGYSKSRDIPIIFLSAINVHKKFITRGYTSGGIDYVTKPFDPDILLLKIKTFYRLSEQTRQLSEMEKNLRHEIELRKQAEAVLEGKVEERTRELRNSNQRLEQSNRDLQQFAYVASHDLQEPLRKIQTFSNIAVEKCLDDKDKVKQYLDKIYTSASRLRQLISDLLNYSMISSDDVFKRYDLQIIISEVLNDIALSGQERSAVILQGSMPEIEVIPSQMRQVFQNLLSNAFKFSRQEVQNKITIRGEVVTEKRLDARVSEKGEYCRITISDNGIGFSDEFNDRIFEIFQRLNTRSAYEGSGIGLSIVKRVIERHDGIISASGRVGEGAVFTIVLPLTHAVRHPFTVAGDQPQEPVLDKK